MNVNKGITANGTGTVPQRQVEAAENERLRSQLDVAAQRQPDTQLTADNDDNGRFADHSNISQTAPSYMDFQGAGIYKQPGASSSKHGKQASPSQPQNVKAASNQVNDYLLHPTTILLQRNKGREASHKQKMEMIESRGQHAGRTSTRMMQDSGVREMEDVAVEMDAMQEIKIVPERRKASLIQSYNLPHSQMNFMVAAEQAATLYAKSGKDKHKVAKSQEKIGSLVIESLEPPRESGFDVRVASRAPKSGTRIHTADKIAKPQNESRYQASQRIMKGAAANLMSQKRQNLNKIRMTRASMGNIFNAQSQRYFEQTQTWMAGDDAFSPISRQREASQEKRTDEINHQGQHNPIKSQMQATSYSNTKTNTRRQSLFGIQTNGKPLPKSGQKSPVFSTRQGLESQATNPSQLTRPIQSSKFNQQQKSKQSMMYQSQSFFRQRQSIQEIQGRDLMPKRTQTQERKFRHPIRNGEFSDLRRRSQNYGASYIDNIPVLILTEHKNMTSHKRPEPAASEFDSKQDGTQANANVNTSNRTSAADDTSQLRPRELHSPQMTKMTKAPRDHSNQIKKLQNLASSSNNLQRNQSRMKDKEMSPKDESEIIGKAMSTYPRVARDGAAGIPTSQKEQRIAESSKDLKKSHPNIVFGNTEKELKCFNLKDEVLSQQNKTNAEGQEPSNEQAKPAVAMEPAAAGVKSVPTSPARVTPSAYLTNIKIQKKIKGQYANQYSRQAAAQKLGILKASTTTAPNQLGSRNILPNTQINGSRSSAQSNLISVTRKPKKSVRNELNADLRFDAARKREGGQKQQLLVEGTQGGKMNTAQARGEANKNGGSQPSDAFAAEPNQDYNSDISPGPHVRVNPGSSALQRPDSFVSTEQGFMIRNAQRIGTVYENEVGTLQYSEEEKPQGKAEPKNMESSVITASPVTKHFARKEQSLDDCPIGSVKERMRTTLREETAERRKKREEFEKRQADHLTDKTGGRAHARRHQSSVMVSESIMRSPTQTLGKVSLIAKRQENVMTNQLIDDREKYLHEHLSLKQELPSPTSARGSRGAKPASPKKQQTSKAIKSPKSPPLPASSGPDYRLSKRMVTRLEALYDEQQQMGNDKAGKPKVQPCFNSEDTNWNDSGKIRRKYVANAQDETVFSRLNPQMLSETGTGMANEARAAHTKMIAGIKKKSEARKKYLQDVDYREMNEHQQETYNLMHRLRSENKPENLQATLQQYIKENKDVEKLTEFCKELEQALKAKQAKRAHDQAEQQKLSKRKTLVPGASVMGLGSSIQGLDCGTRGTRGRQDTKAQQPQASNTNKGGAKSSKQGTSDKLLVHAYLLEIEAEKQRMQQAQKDDKEIEDRVCSKQCQGTTFSITAEQRNHILQKLEGLAVLAQEHKDFMEKRRREYAKQRAAKGAKTDRKLQAEQERRLLKEKIRQQLQKHKSKLTARSGSDQNSLRQDSSQNQSQPPLDSLSFLLEQTNQYFTNPLSSPHMTSLGQLQRKPQEIVDQQAKEGIDDNALSDFASPDRRGSLATGRSESERSERTKQQAIKEQQVHLKELQALKRLQKQQANEEQKMMLEQQKKAERREAKERQKTFEIEIKKNSVLQKRRRVLEDFANQNRSKYGKFENRLNQTEKPNLNLLQNIKNRQMRDAERARMSNRPRQSKLEATARTGRSSERTAAQQNRLAFLDMAKTCQNELGDIPDEELGTKYDNFEQLKDQIQELDEKQLSYIAKMYENLDKLRKYENEEYQDILLDNIINDQHQLQVEEDVLVKRTMKELGDKVSLRQQLRDMYQRAIENYDPDWSSDSD